MIGQTFGHYRILEKIGSGGMGVVYRARDETLEREVALKVLSADTLADEASRQRFRQEALALSRLNHPHICTIYEVGEADGQTYIAMEHVEGRPLNALLAGGRLPLEAAVRYGTQIADALAHAHQRGVLHRDLKSSNVVITPDGRAKVLDFGLAKRLPLKQEPDATQSSVSLTQMGAVVGTLHYLPPEALRHEEADQRRDLWALGVMLYEMLAGQLPFAGGDGASIIYSILQEKPKPLHQLRPDVPAALEQITARALEKDPNLRYRSAAELLNDLTAFQASRSATVVAPVGLQSLWRQIRRPKFAIPGVLLLLALASIPAWLWNRAGKVRWARDRALPEIVRLIEKGDQIAAYKIALTAEQYVPKDPLLLKLWPEMSRVISIETIPPGANVYMKEYAAVDNNWQYLGRSPLSNVRTPVGYFRWRITKDGFQTVEGAGLGPGNLVSFILDKEGTLPAGMVRVPAGTFRENLAGFGVLGPFPLAEYLTDKYEVTNKQFKEFVDQGCYQKREYWKHEFVRDGRVLSWEQAMAQFRDATGRPGPATWEAGSYPDGKDEFPVTGVSWYEAAAYAEFAGKSLPTLYHWYQAARVAAAPYTIPLSNLGGQGPARVGTHPGVGPYGTYDMAGNVKEWCWTEETGGRRYILGGAWNEPTYMFTWAEPRSPFDRSATNGFRCIKYAGSGTPPESLTRPLARWFRDFSKEKPVSDEVFRIFRNLYAYDPAPLNSAVEAVDSSSEYWKKEKVTFDAAYGKERVIAYLFLPKKSAPPFQTLVYFPGQGAILQRSSGNFGGMSALDFVLKNGRAVLYPVYKGTYERQMGLATGRQNRDLLGYWVKDLGRSLDYLESRADIDRNKVGYYGSSWGARLGSIMLALEKRFKVAVLVSGGFPFAPVTPEIDEMNFAPRVQAPVLMLNGRYDFIFPLETSQVPMFRLLGTSQKDKRHVVLDTAHDVLLLRSEAIREVLDWLDRYLGPVKQ